MKASSDTEFSPSQRSGWRRLLRYCAYAFAGLLALDLIGFGVLVAINWNDEALTPETQAWLTEPANPVPDAQNAWLAMQAIGFEKQSGPEVGRRFITAMSKISPYDTTGLKPGDSPERVEQFMKQQKHRFDAQFGPHWEADPAIRQICWNNGEWTGAFSRILAQRKTVEELLRTNHAVLQRYYAAIALPDFFDFSPADYDLHYAVTANQGDITAAACLARMDLGLRLLDGDRSAREPLKHHLRYWITQTTQSHSLIGLMIASGQTKFDLDWSTDLLTKVPASRPALLASKPLWQDLASHSPNELLGGALPAELRSYQNMLVTNFRQSQPPLQRLQKWLTYKPNATLNLRRQLMTESDESRKQSCDWTSWHMAYNFRGKVLDCIAAYSLQNFQKRVQTTLNMASRMSQRLEDAPGAGQ
jgi:hypothetical protein